MTAVPIWQFNRHLLAKPKNGQGGSRGRGRGRPSQNQWRGALESIEGLRALLARDAAAPTETYVLEPAWPTAISAMEVRLAYALYVLRQSTQVGIWGVSSRAKLALYLRMNREDVSKLFTEGAAGASQLRAIRHMASGLGVTPDWLRYGHLGAGDLKACQKHTPWGHTKRWSTGNQSIDIGLLPLADTYTSILQDVIAMMSAWASAHQIGGLVQWCCLPPERLLRSWSESYSCPCLRHQQFSSVYRHLLLTTFDVEDLSRWVGTTTPASPTARPAPSAQAGACRRTPTVLS